MNALRRAWEKELGQGSVVGLAPSSSAAQVLADDLGIATENMANWWQNHLREGETFQLGQLLIIDEASLAGTLSLDRITQLAAEAGGKVLLVGDYAQLQSVDAGGAFGMLTYDRDDVPELVDVHRFTHDWEKRASLDLRHGHTDVIDTYDERQRIVDGDAEAMIDAAYAAWRSDLVAGRATVLVSDSNESVTALNNRARTDLILDGIVRGSRESELHDGTHAAAGDIVITRRNDRRLQAGRGWVRNGDRWNVVDVRRDGLMLARRVGSSWGTSVILPAEYVAEHVELGCAVTSFRAQGVATDTAHVLVDSTMTRETLYVAMTRGRDANVAYVAVDKSDASHDSPHPGENDKVTGRGVLVGVLQYVGDELSAQKTIAASAQSDRWAQLVRSCGLGAEQVEDVIESDAFGPLTAELRRAEANHHDLAVLLPRLVRARDFGNVDDIAAVLRHRLNTATARPAGAGLTRRPPRLIVGLVPEAMGPVADDMRQALDERRDLITHRADAVIAKAIADGDQWIASLGEAPAAGSERERWLLATRTIGAYRDRYAVTTPTPLELSPTLR